MIKHNPKISPNTKQDTIKKVISSTTAIKTNNNQTNDNQTNDNQSKTIKKIIKVSKSSKKVKNNETITPNNQKIKKLTAEEEAKAEAEWLKIKKY